MKNITVNFDWKFVAALGCSAVLFNLSSRLNSDGAKEVLIHAVDAAKDCFDSMRGKKQPSTGKKTHNPKDRASSLFNYKKDCLCLYV